MRELLAQLKRPSRYSGGEWGAVKKDAAAVALRLALAFPDLYEVGMSYLGQQVLYGLVNSRPGWWAERAYCPDREAMAVLRAHAAPLATLESDTPLAELDAVAFHVTHELCFDNVLAMLDLAGIPLRAAQRNGADGKAWPLILAGGGCVCNAEPLAPFVDAMILGDGEAALPPVLEALEAAKAQGLSRRAILEKLAAIQGVYVPEFFTPGDGPSGLPLTPLLPGRDHVRRAVAPSLEHSADGGGCPMPLNPVVPSMQAVHDRLTVEIARGCTRGCRFCHAGMVYRPVRERKPDALAGSIQAGLAASGFDEVSFLSLSTGDYSALEGLFEQAYDRCRAEQVSISLPSLRVGSISGRLMELIARIRRTGVTLAPEAGSQRLRDVINKGVSEADLLDHVGRLFARGWRQVKLYFMIGLPTETQDDLRAIFDLCCKVEAAAGPRAGRLQVTASLSPFVPKPHTPFQWERQIGLDETRERIGFLRELFRTRKRLSLKFHEPRMSYLEGILSRGGRELAPVVERAYRAGALFSSWVDQLDLDAWLAAMAAEGLDPEAFLAARDENAPLPWDHLHVGPTPEFLRRERRRALEAKATPDCRYAGCSRCGVCDLDGQPSELGVPGLANALVRSRRDQSPDAAADAAAQAPDASAPASHADSGPQRHGPARPPELPEDLTRKAGHYRVWYAKAGPAAWLSALEVQSVIARALRRAGVDAAYSQGFHPLPLISFGRALPVGVESRAEWFNLFTRRHYDPADLLARLQNVWPEGFAVLRADPLGPGKKQPQPQVEDYQLSLAGTPAEPVSPDALAAWLAAWAAFAAAPGFPVLRESKEPGKPPREMDLRPMVTALQARDDGVVALTFDWSAGYVSPLFLAGAVAPAAPAGSVRALKLSQR